MFTIHNHPQRYDIHGKPLENLLNMKPTIEYAVNKWEKDTEHTPEFKEYNINYFGVWLEMINMEIEKQNKMNYGKSKTS